MELCVLQHSSASSVEKLDAIARQYPDLSYILNSIAIEIIDLQQAAEDDGNTIDALQEQIKNERKESAEMLESERAAWEAVDEQIDEELLEENRRILEELDFFKSEAWQSGKFDSLIEAREAVAIAIQSLNVVRDESNRLITIFKAAKGKYRGEFLTAARAANDSYRAASDKFFNVPAILRICAVAA